MSNVTARHIDTCLSDYLQDSFSRPGQTLLYASLGGSLVETAQELMDSLDMDAGVPDLVTNGEILQVLKDALKGVDLSYIDENGNPQNEPPEDSDGDEPMVYVVLEWDATVVKMRMTVDVEYQANGTDPYDLKEALEAMIRHVSHINGFTGGTNATVNSWGATAEEVPEE